MPRSLSPAEIEQFRDRLCDAAERMFAEHGPEAVTMRQLASAVGVSSMTPYRYFTDKNAILAAVRARAFDRHAEALESAHAASAGKDPVIRSREIGAAYVGFALDHPEAYKLMFDTQQADAERYPELVRAGERSRATMTRHVRDLAAAGLLKGDVGLAGHLYWSALHGPLMLHFAGMLPKAYGARTLIAGLLQALDAFLGNPVASQTRGGKT